MFERLFDHVFAQCVARGLVAGDMQAVDSAPVKANASLEAVREKQATGPTGQRRRQGTQTGALGARHDQARLLSNKTHYSPTDPDARISVKPGKARALNYRCSLAVDTMNGSISHAQPDLADGRDRLHLPRLLTGSQQRLRANELPLRELRADAGYANGSNHALLEAAHITAWVPVFGQYKAQIDGFTYNAPAADYTCAAGKRLSFRKYDTRADGAWLKLYRATCSDCQQCPLKSNCVPGANRKQLTRTIYDGPYCRAWQRQQTTRGQRMRRVCQGTVEPVFGNLLPHYGLRRLNVRGLAGTHKIMLLTAVAYNLKKLLKYQPTRQVSLAMALPLPLLAVNRRAGCRNRRTQAPTRALTQPLTSKSTA